mmetsp:Transcript_5024/g.14792  ORF Transcript_5024/g.14792 Transcript_5024/m.14792 type:complete len:231 (-) Transcript_5024:745-1437(-)
MHFMSMPFSDKSTTSHSLPRTMRHKMTFFEKWLMPCSICLNCAVSGFCEPSRMFAKLRADAYHEVSRKVGFFSRRQTFLGSNSKDAMVICSNDWQDTAAKINCASSVSSRGDACLRSSSKWSIMRCRKVVVCRKTWISSLISPSLKSQKLRFHTSLSSPQPLITLMASSKNRSGTCLAVAPMTINFFRIPSSASPSTLLSSMPSSTSSTAASHRESFTFRNAALWQATTK